MPIAQGQRLSEPGQSYNSRQGPPPSFNGAPLQSAPVSQGLNSGPIAVQQPQMQQPQMQQHERSFSQGSPIQALQHSAASMGRNGPIQTYNSGSVSSSGPPQLSTLPFQNPQPLSTPFSPISNPAPQATILTKSNSLPPLKPVFGMTLDQLFERDGSAVPMVVYQCIQSVDLYGLEVEGIYRLSGTASHVNKIKSMFDNGWSHANWQGEVEEN
jgi:Rho GTPase-activating protein RGD1